ncbi:hypothetical protein G7Z17_g4981 [Cylindrodendrum hubeiense]|uniref:Uncharacterized protein n=1 Tax=Cylindrodendrum hubeiense TaxID=595255 RepID=A0A9P5H7W9_9HYPO|nr:hypothetical protein G7Z17_g4981 [Cylindrodendrum hubeiense]
MASNSEVGCREQTPTTLKTNDTWLAEDYRKVKSRRADFIDAAKKNNLYFLGEDGREKLTALIQTIKGGYSVDVFPVEYEMVNSKGEKLTKTVIARILTYAQAPSQSNDENITESGPIAPSTPTSSQIEIPIILRITP